MKLRSVLMNTAVALFAVLLLVFTSQAFMSYSVMGFTISRSGYDCINFSGTTKTSLMAVAILLTVLAACLLFVAAVLNILVDCGVVKNEKFAKVARLLNVVLAVVTAVFAVFALVMTIVNVKDTGIMKTGWGVIANVVLAVLAPVVVFVNNHLAKKN